ncbi:MAG TPA: hypothetical protein VIY28_04010 [Pseudonocardiaceae bacterium]
MTLVVLTVFVIALLIAVLAVYLFIVGVLLKRTADNLDDCADNVHKIAGQAKVIGPGVVRINRSGGDLAGALPLLYEAAESIGAEPATPVNAVASPRGLGYLDA